MSQSSCLCPARCCFLRVETVHILFGVVQAGLSDHRDNVNNTRLVWNLRVPCIFVLCVGFLVWHCIQYCILVFLPDVSLLACLHEAVYNETVSRLHPHSPQASAASHFSHHDFHFDSYLANTRAAGRESCWQNAHRPRCTYGKRRVSR